MYLVKKSYVPRFRYVRYIFLFIMYIISNLKVHKKHINYPIHNYDFNTYFLSSSIQKMSYWIRIHGATWTLVYDITIASKFPLVHFINPYWAGKKAMDHKTIIRLELRALKGRAQPKSTSIYL